MQHFLNQGPGPFARLPFVARLIVRPGCRISSRLAVLVGLMLTLRATPDLFGQTTGVLTNLAQVNALPLTKATNGIPVKVRVTITYMDPDWRMMFVQDDTGSIFVTRNAPSGDASWNLPPGQVVDLEGTPSRGIIQCNLAEQKLHPVGQGPLPKPWLLDSEESFKNADDARWVTVTGVITGVRTLEKKLDLDLQVAPSRSIRLIVAQGNPVSAATLIGSMASVTGVYGMDLDANSKPTGRNEIWLNDLAEVQKTHALPITPIGDLTIPVTKRLPAQMSRVLGNVVTQRAAKFLTIRDNSGSVQVNSSVTNLIRVGSPVPPPGIAATQHRRIRFNA